MLFTLFFKRFAAVFILMMGLMAAANQAWATPRTFPANALRGTLTATIYPQVTINGNTMTLAPGAKIYGKKNLIIMHSTLANREVVVNYTLDNMGYVNRVWVLTQEELDQ